MLNNERRVHGRLESNAPNLPTNLVMSSRIQADGVPLKMTGVQVLLRRCHLNFILYQHISPAISTWPWSWSFSHMSKSTPTSEGSGPAVFICQETRAKHARLVSSSGGLNTTDLKYQCSNLSAHLGISIVFSLSSSGSCELRRFDRAVGNPRSTYSICG